MIEGPADHGLHMTYQLHPFVLKSYMPRLYLSYHRYELFFVSPHRRYNLISLVPTRLSISTSSFWSRSLMCRMWAKQAICFDSWPTREDYLQINAFPNLVVIEREEYPHALQRKATRGATSKVVRGTAGWTWPGLTLKTSISASTIHHTTRWVEITAE